MSGYKITLVFMTKYLFPGIMLAFVMIRLGTMPTYQDGVEISLHGQVLREPTRVANGVFIRYQQFRIQLSGHTQVEYGDHFTLKGVYKEGLIVAHEFEIVDAPNAFYLNRRRMIEFFEAALPEPHSALVLGLVFGSKQNLSSADKDLLKKTGTSHVVVASGMNVALVGGFVLSVFIRIIRRQVALVVTIVAIWVYIFIAGLEGPLVRSGIMISLVFVSQLLGRVVKPGIVLFYTVLGMLLWQPGWIGDIGFQLSVAATASLILFENKISTWVRVLPEPLRSGFSTSLAAQILVLPLILLYFGQVSLIGPFVNALVLWTVPFITIMGMLVGVMSLAISPIAQSLAFFIYPLTAWFWGIVNLTSKL